VDEDLFPSQEDFLISIHTIYIYIYIYMCVCVCVCVCFAHPAISSYYFSKACRLSNLYTNDQFLLNRKHILCIVKSSRLVLCRRKKFDFYENFSKDINKPCAKTRFPNVTAGS